MVSTLFIPDISGFTRFVNTTEIEHSKHIIEELLNIMVDVGKKHFELAEIEGDAVFFYKENVLFKKDILEDISREMYSAFHEHLQIYEHKRICTCGACTSAIDLKLKFITHAGRIELTQFKGSRAKPYGSAVIAIHRLLKNDIKENEYLLLTSDVCEIIQPDRGGEGSIKDEDLGEIEFCYQLIDHWKVDIPKADDPRIHPPIDMSLSITGNISLEPTELIKLISDLKYRKWWNKQADEIIYDDSEINQVGGSHYCVIRGNNYFFDTIKPEQDRTQLAYGEVLKTPGLFKYAENGYLLFPAENNSTRLEVYFKMSYKWKLQFLMKPFLKMMFQSQLNTLVKDIEKAVPMYRELN